MWDRTVRLGDICSFNSKSYTPKMNWDFVNYLDTGNITNGEIQAIQQIDLRTEKLPSRAKRCVKYNSIVYSTVRPNQRHFGIMKNIPDNFLVSTGFAVLDIDEKQADADFIYYYLMQEDIINGLEALAEQNTSTYPSIKPSDIADVVIHLPNLSVQHQIAAILTALDAKKAINQKINDNLQQQAQAIYMSFFVKNADASWEKGHLSNLVNIKYGKDHKNLADGIYPVYGSGGIIRYAEKFLYDKESVLVPRKGTLNNVIYVNQPFWSVDTMFYTEMKLPNIAKFVFHFIKSKDLNALNAGSAVPSMTTSLLNAMEVLIPPQPILERFEAIVSPMYDIMQKNAEQNKTLLGLRNCLLFPLITNRIHL